MVDLAAFGAVTGLELADASVAKARERAVGEVVQGTLDAMPFAAGSFDLAVSLDVIEHLEDDRLALAELRRVVAAGRPSAGDRPGLPAAVEPARRRQPPLPPVHAPHARVAAAGAAGWRTVSSTHFNGLLLPAAVAHRGLQRLRPPTDDALSDLERTPGRLNGVLSSGRSCSRPGWSAAGGGSRPACR